MRWARGAAAVAVALALFVSAGWLLGWSSSLDPRDALAGRKAWVNVPDLAGLARPRAVADVRSARLAPRVRTAFSIDKPRGAVIAQRPVAGTRVREGSEVTVVVSRGVTRVDMPAAVGRPLAEVVGPLDEAGVDYRVDKAASETVPAGVVVSQSPAAGRKVTASDDVHFVVSTGPDPRAVPEVAGMSADGAAFALGRAGFAVGEMTPLDDAQRPPGAVVRTEPAAGAVQPRDTAVKVFTSAGPPPVAVPNVVGQSTDAAISQLQGVGLVPNVTGWVPGGGRVLSQQPAAGATARPGTLVAVGVGGA